MVAKSANRTEVVFKAYSIQTVYVYVMVRVTHHVTGLLQ